MPKWSSFIETNASKDNLVFVCQFLIKHYRIKNTTFKLSNLIHDHLEYPSLLAIVDALSKYGIESAAIRKENHEYIDFEVPFICSIQQPDWAQPLFTVVTSVDEKEIHYLDPLQKNETSISQINFDKIDKGLVLLVDGDDAKDEPEYLKNRENEKRNNLKNSVPILLLAVTWGFTAIYSLLFLDSTNNLIAFLFLILNTVGAIVSILLLWHDIDAHNPFLKQVCGRQGSKLNCDAVLQSKGASFLGFSWSALGLSYFVSILLSQLLFGISNTDYFPYWCISSLLVVPYTFYSIYYQWKVVRQWCPLCLIIQGVLTLSAGLSILYIYNSWSNPLTVFPLITLLMLGVLVLVLTTKLTPLLKASKENKEYKKKWNRLRYNPDIFSLLLQKEAAVTFPVEDLGLQLGNQDAKNEIIKVCNPYCGPCSKVHPALEELIRSNPNIKVRIIFTATGEDNDIKTAPVRHLLAIQERYGKEVVSEALDSWYHSEVKEYATFAEQYPMNGELKQQSQKIEAMRLWCDQMKIRATPTFFINGRELPDSYEISDLTHIL